MQEGVILSVLYALCVICFVLCVMLLSPAG